MEISEPFRNWLEKSAPKSLYASILIPYWFLHPYRKKVLIIPNDDSWFAKQENSKFFVPNRRIVRSLASERPYEKYFDVEEGDTIIDAGACVGRDTISFANEVGENGQIFAIEPQPINLNFLRRNVRLNNLNNVEIVCKAIGKQRDSLELHLSESGSNASYYDDIKFHSTELTSESVEVEVDTLDNIIPLSSIESVDFLKMNVEGAEIDGLNGASCTLEETEKVMVSIHHRDGLSVEEKVCHQLENKGFRTELYENSTVVKAWKE